MLKTAELLSLKGNTRGQRDELVNEILKVHTRFTARLGEYRFLLNMAEQFFNNLAQVSDPLTAAAPASEVEAVVRSPTNSYHGRRQDCGC